MEEEADAAGMVGSWRPAWFLLWPEWVCCLWKRVLWQAGAQLQTLLQPGCPVWQRQILSNGFPVGAGRQPIALCRGRFPFVREE